MARSVVDFMRAPVHAIPTPCRPAGVRYTGAMWQTVALLGVSNLFMTFAWYGHLKHLRDSPLPWVILASWGIAFLEYCFQVPANRIGAGHYSLGQLKVLQEVVTMTVFAVFAVLYMKAPLTKNFLYASLCLVAAAWFIFRDGLPAR
jgi:uncharacterized protein (DUF486 family)